MRVDSRTTCPNPGALWREWFPSESIIGNTLEVLYFGDAALYEQWHNDLSTLIKQYSDDTGRVQGNPRASFQKNWAHNADSLTGRGRTYKQDLNNIRERFKQEEGSQSELREGASQDGARTQAEGRQADGSREAGEARGDGRVRDPGHHEESGSEQGGSRGDIQQALLVCTKFFHS